MTIFSNQRGFIGKLIFLTVLFTLIGLGYLVYKNLPDSVEGDWIYPLKNIREILTLSQYEFDYASRAKAYIDYSTMKMNELKKLVEKKADKDKMSHTIKMLNYMQEEAIANINQAQLHGDSIAQVKDKFKTTLEDQIKELDQMIFQVEQGNYQLIIDAKSQLNTNLERIAR